MILESRKWRLVIRILTLVVTTVLILAVAGPVSYALQDDTPKQVSISRQLFDEKGKPIADSFVDVEVTPRIDQAISTGAGDSTHYWIPVREFGSLLFIRTDKSKYLFPYDYDPALGFLEQNAVSYSGKVTKLVGQPDAEDAIKALAAKGIVVDKENAMVLLQGEEPSTYRPMVPVVPVLALFWTSALVGAWQILRGRRPRRALARAGITGLG